MEIHRNAYVVLYERVTPTALLPAVSLHASVMGKKYVPPAVP